MFVINAGVVSAIWIVARRIVCGEPLLVFLLPVDKKPGHFAMIEPSAGLPPEGLNLLQL